MVTSRQGSTRSLVSYEILFHFCIRTEALGKRRDDLQNLLNGLRMGVVSASSEESRSGLDDDAQELARFAKDIDYAPVRVSAQDERLTAAAATIARLQPSVARFDSMFLQVTWLPRLFYFIENQLFYFIENQLFYFIENQP